MFASKVTQYFKSAIEKRYPTPEFQQDISSEEMEHDNQWAFVTERAATMIGREEEIEKLLQFAQGMEKNLQISEKYQPYSRKIEGWQIESSDNKLCVVEARSGWGKTSLLAKLTRTLVLEGCAVFYHFCGSTNLSKQPENLVQRLINFLKKQIRECGKDSKDNKEEEKSPHKILQQTFKDTRKVQKNLTIVIDAVNELTCMDMANHLSWLPPCTPCNVKIIVSSNQHTPSLSHLAEHPCYWLKLSHLDESNLKQLAINYLRTFNKRLDSEQLDLLINGTGADNPLWVRLMCEELRVFGDFRHLTHKILQFPKSLDDLFSLIFSRLLAEDSTGCIKKVLCLIAISYSGLPCADILKILGDVVKDDTILLPRLHWAQARRHLKPYIRTIGYPNDLLTFSHESIWKAVEKILLTNKSEVVRLHVNLADYFQNICEHHELRSRCVPYHLSLGNLGKRMIDFLYTDVDAARLPDIMRSDYLQAFRCQYFASSQIPNTKEVKFCAFCSNRRCKMKSGSFAYVNKDCCIICGARIIHVHNFSSSIGRTCTFHSVGPLNSTKCFSCSNYIWEKQYDTGNSGVKGYLCHSCGFGHKSNFCSILAPRS